MLNDWAIVRVMEGAAAYHFRFFQYFINRKATMKPIRTTGQCLLAHFQNGLSSVDRRRKNSVKRSITSPRRRFLSDQLRCSKLKWEQESCKDTRRESS